MCRTLLLGVPLGTALLTTLVSCRCHVQVPVLVLVLVLAHLAEVAILSRPVLLLCRCHLLLDGIADTGRNLPQPCVLWRLPSRPAQSHHTQVHGREPQAQLASQEKNKPRMSPMQQQQQQQQPSFTAHSSQAAPAAAQLLPLDLGVERFLWWPGFAVERPDQLVPKQVAVGCSRQEEAGDGAICTTGRNVAGRRRLAGGSTLL